MSESPANPLERILDLIAEQCAGEYPGFEISAANVRLIAERVVEIFGPTLGLTSYQATGFGIHPMDLRVVLLSLEMTQEYQAMNRRLEHLEAKIEQRRSRG